MEELAAITPPPTDLDANLLRGIVLRQRCEFSEEPHPLPVGRYAASSRCHRSLLRKLLDIEHVLGYKRFKPRISTSICPLNAV